MIKKLGKLLGLDLGYFLANGIFLSAHNVLAALSALLLSVVFSEFLTKDVFGQYNLVLSIVSALSITALPGASAMVVQAISKGNFGNYRLGLKMSFRWSLLGSAVLLLSALYYFVVSEQTILGTAFLIAAILFSPQSVSNFYAAYYLGQKKIKSYIVRSLAHVIISTVFLITATIFFGTPPILVLTFFVSIIITQGFFTGNIYRRIKSKQTDVPSLKFGRYVSLIEALQTAVFYIDNILVGLLLGFESLAIYSFAKIIPEQIKGVAKNIGDLALPKLSQMDATQIKKSLMGKFWQFTFLMAAMMVIYIVFAPTIYKFLFPAYIEAVFPSQIFAISLVTFPIIIFNYTFQSHALKRETFISRMAPPLAQLALLLIFITYWGLIGAILARVLGRFFNLLLNIYLFKTSAYFISSEPTPPTAFPN